MAAKTKFTDDMSGQEHRSSDHLRSKPKNPKLMRFLEMKHVPSALIDRALIAWPRGPQAQLGWLFEGEGSLRADSSRLASDKTIDDRRNAFRLFFLELQELGFKIENILNLNQAHVLALHADWQRKEHAAASVKSRQSHLRFLCKLIGKPGMVPSDKMLATLISNYKIQKRVTVAQNDKSWNHPEIDMNAIRSSAHEISTVFGLEIETMEAFGLRLKECVMLTPHRQDKTKYLLVDRGTKGGRKRETPIETQRQREVLDATKAFVSRSDSLSGKGRGTLKQVYRRCQADFDLLRKMHPELDDYSLHGLRHGAFHEALRRRGLPVPVAGDRMVHSLTEQQKALLLEVAEAFGHSRTAISRWYAGSFVVRKT